MNEPTITEAVQTDLPSPKPNCRRRLALRFAVLVVAVSALGAAYWLMRPPELVWWRSPELGSSGRHVRLLLPAGWELRPAVESDPICPSFSFMAVDRLPAWIKWIGPIKKEDTELRLNIGLCEKFSSDWRPPSNITLSRRGGTNFARRAACSWDGQIRPDIIYYRVNTRAFNRTYRRICNSLRIE
jgi:hypothetical protein